MAGILLFTVAGFAMMAYGTNQGTKLVGYCKYPNHSSPHLPALIPQTLPVLPTRLSACH